MDARSTFRDCQDPIKTDGVTQEDKRSVLRMGVPALEGGSRRQIHGSGSQPNTESVGRGASPKAAYSTLPGKTPKEDSGTRTTNRHR